VAFVIDDVTIIVPAFGARSGLLERALRSVLQANEARELIVVDDGSPGDSVREVAERVGGVRYVRRSTNGGVAAAQNSGVHEARSSFIAFLHSDDILVPGHIHAQVGLLHGGADVAAASALIGDRVFTDPVSSALPADFLRFRFGVHVSQYLFPRELMVRFSFDEALRTWEDWDLLFRLKLAGLSFAAVDRVIVEITGDASARLSNSPVNGPALIYLGEKYRHHLRDRRALRSLWQFKIGRSLLREGEQRQGRRWIGRSLVTEPWHPRRAACLFRPGPSGAVTGHPTRRRV
jgi:glycosyltransferase involved in cell wall biosynthesis